MLVRLVAYSTLFKVLLNWGQVILSLKVIVIESSINKKSKNK